MYVLALPSYELHFLWGWLKVSETFLGSYYLFLLVPAMSEALLDAQDHTVTTQRRSYSLKGTSLVEKKDKGLFVQIF